MANSDNLRKAKAKKDDEFYTRREDVENELRHYKPHFDGKVVYCNCDDPEWSEFFIYFKNNFDHLNLKKLISTHYVSDNLNEKAYKLECVEFTKENGIAISSKKYLEGDGDFRSPECIELLKESDIVCTNPPFSLFREYVQQLMDYEKRFLIIGNVNSIIFKQIFRLIQENKIWIGVSPRSMSFFQDIERTKSKVVNACWFTNLEHKKRNEEIILWRNLDKDFIKYENFDAIDVSRVSEIPCDFYDLMGVPITFLDRYNPNQFEIVGIAKRGPGDISLRTKIYTKEDHPNYSDLNAGPVIKVNGELKSIYPRILIKRKVKYEN